MGSFKVLLATSVSMDVKVCLKLDFKNFGLKIADLINWPIFIQRKISFLQLTLKVIEIKKLAIQEANHSNLLGLISVSKRLIFKVAASGRI